MILGQILQFAADPNACQVHQGCAGALCPASALDATTAAWATQGYWVQSDIIDYLTLTGFGLWAPMLYVLAGLGGFIGLATGMPPRNYMWFFIGPALYSWLLDTREPVHGVEWQVATQKQDQTRVWKYAEPGLRNSNIVKRLGVTITKDAPPDQEAYVALPFLWFDILISDTVQNLIDWSGIYKQGGDGGSDSNIAKAPEDSLESNSWYLMSTEKWKMLNDITGATLKNAHVRDLLVSFLSSDCGDALSKAVDDKAIVAASQNKSGALAPSIFIGCDSDDITECKYDNVTQALARQEIPLPRELRNLWRSEVADGGHGGRASGTSASKDGSFDQFVGNTFTPSTSSSIDNYLDISSDDSIHCDDLLNIIIQGFRWESGHAYYQLVSNKPDSLKEADIVYNLFYAWDLKEKEESGGSADSAEPLPVGNSSEGDGETATPDQIQFLKDLILIHLFRNEMALMPQVVDTKYAPTTQAENYMFAAQRTVGSQTKYAEVYSWALMMPKVQGVVLYFLAMAYPFACVLMVVPGWHKAIFTWASFWAWAKLWDLGFALVMVIERSMWAMISNDTQTARVASKVIEMGNWHKVAVACSGMDDCPSNPCIFPKVTSVLASASSSSDPTEQWNGLLRVFDRSVLLSNRLDLDLANGWYIYLMSALYFAVPAVTGQLVLGAKAGAASLVGNFFSGVQQDGGKAAGGAYTGDYQQRMSTNSGTVGQEGYAKGVRKSGLGLQALEMANSGLMMSAGSSAMETEMGLMGGIGKIFDNSTSSRRSGIAAARAVKGAVEGFSDDVGKINRANKGTSASPLSGAPGAGGAATGAPGTAKGVGRGPMAPAGLRGTRVGSGLSHGFDALAAMADWGANNQNLEFSSRIAASQNGANVAKWGIGAAASGNQMALDRGRAHAGYEGDMSAWEARRKFGNNLSGMSVAVGVLAGQVSPGQKDTGIENMAMAGMLGSSAKQKANYSNPFAKQGQGGEYYGAIGGIQQGLDSKYGEQASLAWGETVTPMGGLAQIGAEASPNYFGGYSAGVGTAPGGAYLPMGGTRLGAGTPEGGAGYKMGLTQSATPAVGFKNVGTPLATQGTPGQASQRYNSAMMPSQGKPNPTPFTKK